MSIKFGNSGRLGLKVKLLAVAMTITLSGAAAFMPSVAGAQSTADVIAQLQAQIQALQAQLVGLSGGSVSTGSVGSCTFTKNLYLGVRGDDVKCLQTSLKVTPASGYFGPLTKAAVAKWQAASGVTPAAGYFGALSRAKYSSMAVSTPSTPTTPTTPTTPVVTVPAGSGLTVTPSVDQPAATLAPNSAARIPFVKSIFTASSDGDVTVNSVTVERRGLADDAAFDGVILLDENGVQIGNSKTLSSEHKVLLNEPFVVKAGTSKTITVAANMGSSLGSYSGTIAKMALVAVDAGTTKVNLAAAIESNGMTINSNLTIGSVTMSIGSLDPGAANTKDVATKGYYLASVKASVGSAEDVTFKSIRFNQAGSAAASDLANVVVKVGEKDYPAVVQSTGKYYYADLGDGVKVTKGGNLEFSVKADLVSGSARTVDMDILRKSDIVAVGNTFGYSMIVSGGSAGAASAGAFSSNQEPFFNAYAATINKGSVSISSSNTIPAGNAPIDVADTDLGAFTFSVKGEPIQFSSMVLNFNFTGSGGTSSNITSVKLYNENGGIVAGPKDPASGIVTWTDTWTAPIGDHVYKVKGRLGTTFTTNNTVQVGLNADNMTAKGQTTGLTITVAPASTLINANTQTVRGAALSFSVSPTPFAQNVVRGLNGYTFATYVFDAGQSGEDVRVTTVQLQDTLSANTVGDEINTCVLYDGATALNSGSDQINPSDPSSGTDNDISFNLTNALIVPKGTVKKVDLKCNISSSAANNSTHSWGTSAAAANISSSGASTGSSITETITTGNGQAMTIKSAGSFTVTQDTSTPLAALVIAGKTDVPMHVFKYHATDEAVKITEVTLTYSSSTASTSDFLKVKLWDGATKIGEATWAGSSSQFATSTLTSDFVVPKDGDKLLTVTADLSSIGVVASTTAGRLLSINYDANSSSTGLGVSSGVKLGSSSTGSVQGNTMQIMKSIPTLAKVAVPSTSVPQSGAILYRFSVTADPAGPIGLYKFTFSVSSSTISATTSNFQIYGYSDSSFTSNAYSNNPISANNVDCLGYSTFGNPNPASCATIAAANLAETHASNTDVVFYFNPVANSASTTESIAVPAGTTRYFELRGDITTANANTGNVIKVQLEGDAARPVVNGNSTDAYGGVGNFGGAVAGQSRLATAVEVSRQSANNDFVWSPMSTTTTLAGATSTPDWTNGFRVPGLPDTYMSANNFTN